ncbi:molybdopterin oxidoreductase family protein [Luteolibacter sp. AS25]|uniref:molybdopterin oxidoreductase family protein n=1 Tax=Luteolibacter sp. AS25 TaxID=3135776 RepID=UPI00398B4692
MSLFSLKSHDGPLTADLIQEPGNFGLGKIPSRLRPISTTTSICGYCATGCQLKLHLDEDGNAINLSPEVNYPVNLGMACPKGWQALDPLTSSERATVPLLRDCSGTLQPTDWTTALTEFTTRLKEIKTEHGSESVAFLSTGQIPFEEMAFLGCLYKFGMGFIHADANTRQCMATAATAYKQSFGFDAPPGAYADFEESDVIVLIGANLCIAHPILWQRVMRNKRSPQIIVIDPRATETAQAATTHLAIKPKGDLALLHSVAYCILRDGRIDEESISNTEGIDDYREFVKDYSPEAVAEKAGITAHAIETLAKSVSEKGKRVSWWWTMGINQSHEGTRTVQAIINLCLITGNIGKPGTGPNSVTGQCNAMGSRLFSNTTSLVGGHDFANEGHRRKISEKLEIPYEHITSQGSLAYDQILDAVAEGKIKALWIVATNPFHSWIDSDKLEKLRANLDFLVVQDMYSTTESALTADLLLPAASWGEKSGCFINSERRLGTIKPVRKAPGQALSDFRIFRLIADAWGCGEFFKNWTSPEAAFKILRDVTRDQPCDITGIKGYDHIDECSGIQWPYPENPSDTSTERRLFADGKYYTPSRKARIHFSAPAELPEKPDDQYPFLLLTGRGTSSQWHTQSRTAKSSVLRKLYPENAYVEICSADALKLGIKDKSTVRISSRRGALTASAYIAPTVRPGNLFLPMHYPEVNKLTHSSFDPHSRQPNYKACSVSISRID